MPVDVPDAQQGSEEPKVASPPAADQAKVTAPSEPTPVYVYLPVLGAIAYAHLALAWQLGFSFERVAVAVPKPWSTLTQFLGASLTASLLKPALLDFFSLRLLRFSRRQAWGLRWHADNYHLLSTLLGSWAVVFGTESAFHIDDLDTGSTFLIVTALLFVVLVAILNIYYAENRPVDLSVTTDDSVGDDTRPKRAASSDASTSAQT